MSPFRSLLLLFAAAALSASGCRCGPTEDDLPASRATPSASASESSSCPQRPSWAGALDSTVEIEVLHAAETASGPHGTGFRLHDGGRLETYDDVLLQPDDAGRMTFQKVQGTWRDRGTVTAQALGDLRKLMKETDAKVLRGRQATKVRGGRAFTLVSARRDGTVMESCYDGQLPPSGTEPIQKAVHDLVNRVSR